MINMARPTRVYIDQKALLHNVKRINVFAPNKKIIAMVKANAYGCGLAWVVPALTGHVYAFGVACLEEARLLRALDRNSPCVLIQGLFYASELLEVSALNLQCVIHQPQQLQWILTTPLDTKIKVWVKVDTGMHRLGLMPEEVASTIHALQACPWVDPEIGIMTHLACADEPDNAKNSEQLEQFNHLPHFAGPIIRSIANSAAIIALPEMHADVIRPGIMLYGVSPFADKIGADFGLLPVMRFESAITAIHDYPVNTSVGYGGRWKTNKPSRIAIVAAGYGDGYPRHISPGTAVWVKGHRVPIVGVISMDMLTIDVTDHPEICIGDVVELWGQYVPVEQVAKSAGTIPYELLCQVTQRVRG